METERQWQAAIEDQPGDDTTWLVLADWLEDRGEADRGELVRLQVMLRRDIAAADRARFEERLRTLLARGVLPWMPLRRVPLAPRVELPFVLIPPGRFNMGSPLRERGRERREGPVHRVTLTRGFWLGVHPVTQAQWQAVMGENPSRFRGEDRPVEHVTWHEAFDFCRRLGGLTGGRFRLPSEAEWEYACRAGTTSPYHAGKGVEALRRVGWCNYEQQVHTATETADVGGYQPNAFGLFDMHGNVWEWCADWFGPYTGEEQVDPQGPPGGEGRVVRGGSWYYAPRICRSAYRFFYAPAGRNDSHGCRVVMEWHG